MPGKTASPSSIAGGLSVLYAVYFTNGVLTVFDTWARWHAVFLVVLYFILFAGALGSAFLKDPARRALIVFNVVALAYFGLGYLRGWSFIHPADILLPIIVIAYFTLPLVRVLFLPKHALVRKSILVVDDDEGLIKTVQKVLLSGGYSVLSATSGEKGLQVAALQQPDLILLDVILPGIKGREVCARLKADEKTKNIPVIFLTAKDSPDDISAELALGAISHLTKPVDAKKLLAEVDRALKA